MNVPHSGLRGDARKKLIEDLRKQAEELQRLEQLEPEGPPRLVHCHPPNEIYYNCKEVKLADGHLLGMCMLPETWLNEIRRVAWDRSRFAAADDLARGTTTENPYAPQ